MNRPRLVGLTLGEAPDAWRAAGFDVDEEGVFTVGTLVLHASGRGAGIQGWTLGNGPSSDVDGLATTSVPVIGPAPRQEHPNGVSALDHLVIGSPNRDRTIRAFATDLGLEPRRQSEHELYGRAMVQTFFLLAPTLLEVISRPQAEGDGPAVFWGVAFVVEDIEATAAALGDACSPPKDAVQPGRRIATLRHEAAGLATPVAFITPRG